MRMLTSEQQHAKMIETPITKLLVTLSLPAIITMLLSSIYNMADTYFVTSLGESAIGAVGVVFSIQYIIQAVGYGVAMGCSSIVSRKLGEKKNKEANEIASSALTLGILLGIVIALIGLTFLNPILSFIGATDTILPHARDYATMILIAAPVMCGQFVFGPLLRAEGKATLSMIVSMSGGVINFILDPIFIFTFKMGVQGAALATAISQLISFLVAIIFYISGKSVIKLSTRSISKNFSVYWDILRTGAPTIFRQGLSSVATTLLNVQMKVYGDAAVAAVSLANKVYIFIRAFVLGVGQGFQPIVGYNYGAKRIDRVRKVFGVAILFGSGVAVLGAILCAWFPTQIMNIFGASNVDVTNIGVRLLTMYSFALPFLGFSSYVNMMYQALGKVKGATFMASCRQGIFFIPLILLLPQYFGMGGALMSQPTADILTCIASIPFCIVILKTTLRKQEAIS